MTAAAVDATLGELLSPSQVNAFLSCRRSGISAMQSA
jgi:hypothetical protein